MKIDGYEYGSDYWGLGGGEGCMFIDYSIIGNVRDYSLN
jgi:hypothetical protein